MMQWILNPIIVKEVRSRMRGVRAFITLTILLALFGLVSFGVYKFIELTTYYGYYGVPLTAMVGQSIFGTLSFLLLAMIFLITPAVTAGAISNERQMLTYEMLLATPLSPGRILWGKLTAGLTYILMLIFAVVPFASLIYIFGGVSVRDMLKVLLVLISLAVFIGVTGIFFSVILGRTARATIATYVFIIVLVILPILAAGIYGIVNQVQPPRWLLVANPFVALQSAMAPSLSSGSPLESIWYLLGLRFFSEISPISQTGIPRPIYHYSLPLYGALSLVFYLVAARLVQPVRRWHIGWKNAVVMLAVMGGFAGGVYGAFAASSNRYDDVSFFASPTPFPEAFMEKGIIVQAVPDKGIAPMEAGIILDETSSIYSVETQAEMYRAVIENANRGATTIFIKDHTNDEIGDPNVHQREGKKLDQSLIDALQKQLESAGYKVIWLSGPDEMKPDPGSAIFTVGNIQLQNVGQVMISVQVHTVEVISGMTLVVTDAKDGIWAVARNTGVVWEKAP